MADLAPAAVATLNSSFAVTPVTVRARCNVCYEFDTRATSADLAIPYLIVVNDRVQDTPKDAPHALDKNTRQIHLMVEQGSQVALILNSDVHPDYRSHPVYAVQVTNNDVSVKITEQTGRIGHERPIPKLLGSRPSSKPGGLPVDYYEAKLTGDIWMQISHCYTSTEADALLPTDTDAAIRLAIRNIYSGLPAPRLQLTFQANDVTPQRTLKVNFTEAENVLANTTYCPLLSGVLSRTHPCAFAALFAEAYAVGVTELLVTSTWRPMLGSIVHRAGLGLDVVYIANGNEKVRINRVGLNGRNGAHNENVSEREKQLYAEYEAAKKHASEKTVNSDKTVSDAKESWDREREKNEPKLMHNLREKLQHHPGIRQVFDPWYMAVRAQDNTASANEQISSNERLHANHMHLTVNEPKIL